MQHPVREEMQKSVRVDSARPQAAERARAAQPTMPWADRWAFLSGFLQHPGEVGSVIPSSGRLEQRLVRTAGLAQARTVVELGPGTGGTTRAFLRAMGPQARLLAIELSPVFAERLARLQPDPRLTRIVRDETRHAELAWRTIAWAIATGGPEVRTALMSAATAARLEHEHEHEHEHAHAHAHEHEHEHVRALGRLSPLAQSQAARDAWTQIITPTLSIL